ncbi:TniQ family protein, partial [Pelagivirga sediminicola]|uniref:TniQ family protein n=1 Tax=Pelagivirga sediminicola TaxID=2170575 RepID=UPI001404256C
VDDFYAARSRLIPPLPRPTFAPPFSQGVYLLRKLALTVEPVDRETLPSLFSRMAILNGTDAVNFALDLGTTFRRILEQDEEAVAIFAERAGLSATQVAELLSWTGERIGDVRMRFRKEVFVSRALRNPIIRGCPHCMREHAADQPHPLRHIALRGDWLCRGVDICHRHHHPLVPLWSSSRPIVRDDIGARLAEILPDLRAGSFNCVRIDLWLDKRLSQGIAADKTWLASQPVFAAMTICEFIGAALLRKRDEAPDDRHAKATGFAFVSQGPDGVRAALDILMRSQDGGHIVTQGELGPLFQHLKRIYLDDDAFAVFRGILRDYFLEIWPLAAGEDFFGQAVTERRLHSLTSASKETGIGSAVLDDFLTEAGAFAPSDARADARKTFDAKAWQHILDEIPTLVGPIALRRAIGATLAELKGLKADGVLVPRTKVATIKSPWRIADGQALLEELEAYAQPVAPEEPGWKTIQLVHKRLELPVGAIIAAIRSGFLRLGKRSDVFGYHGLVVEITEVTAFKAKAAPKRKPSTKQGEVTAAAFARSAGIRGKGKFLALIKGGYTPAMLVLNPTTRRREWRMSRDDIAAFEASYTTPTILSAETGAHLNTIRAVLQSEGVQPYRPNGLDVGPVYLRNEVEPVVALLKTQGGK